MMTVKEVNNKIEDIRNAERMVRYHIASTLTNIVDPSCYSLSDGRIVKECIPGWLNENSRHLKEAMEQIDKLIDWMDEYIKLLENAPAVDLANCEVKSE